MDIQTRIINQLKGREALSITQLAEELNLKYDDVFNEIVSLIADGQVEMLTPGHYALPWAADFPTESITL